MFFGRIAPPDISSFIQTMEKYATQTESKEEKLSPESYLNCLKSDFELKRREEKQSLLKPDFLYSHRLQHSKFINDNLPVSEKNIEDFFEKLDVYSKKIPADELLIDHFFARIIAWLHQFKFYIIYSGIEIPANFTTALTDYQIKTYVNHISNKNSAIREAAIQALGQIPASGLSSAQIEILLRPLIACDAKESNYIKKATIESLDQVVTYSDLTPRQIDTILNKYLSFSISYNGHVRKAASQGFASLVDKNLSSLQLGTIVDKLISCLRDSNFAVYGGVLILNELTSATYQKLTSQQRINLLAILTTQADLSLAIGKIAAYLTPAELEKLFDTLAKNLKDKDWRINISAIIILSEINNLNAQRLESVLAVAFDYLEIYMGHGVSETAAQVIVKLVANPNLTKQQRENVRDKLAQRVADGIRRRSFDVTALIEVAAHIKLTTEQQTQLLRLLTLSLDSSYLSRNQLEVMDKVVANLNLSSQQLEELVEKVLICLYSFSGRLVDSTQCGTEALCILAATPSYTDGQRAHLRARLFADFDKTFKVCGYNLETLVELAVHLTFTPDQVKALLQHLTASLKRDESSDHHHDYTLRAMGKVANLALSLEQLEKLVNDILKYLKDKNTSADNKRLASQMLAQMVYGSRSDHRNRCNFSFIIGSQIDSIAEQMQFYHAFNSRVTEEEGVKHELNSFIVKDCVNLVMGYCS